MPKKETKIINNSKCSANDNKINRTTLECDEIVSDEEWQELFDKATKHSKLWFIKIESIK